MGVLVTVFVEAWLGWFDDNNNIFHVCKTSPNASFRFHDTALGSSKTLNGSDTLRSAFTQCDADMTSSAVVDHEQFAGYVRRTLNYTGFSLVLGPKHVGKTK
eukprot:5722851-Amphidinium_carterae.1